MSGLRKQIEKKAKTADDIKHLIWQVDEQTDGQIFLDVVEEKWVRLSDVLGLLADYEKNHFIFPVEKIKEMKLLDRVKILFSDYSIIKRKWLENWQPPNKEPLTDQTILLLKELLQK